MTVIDGVHRLSAARQLGWSRVVVEMFDGDDDEARVRAVAENVRHGLPLTMQERKRAAGVFLASHPSWSDARVGQLCGLARRTVSDVRRSLGATNELHTSEQPGSWRLGRDGRMRPTEPSDLRERIAKALDMNPMGTLREIARVVGASPETVRDVKKAKARGAEQAGERSPTWSAALEEGEPGAGRDGSWTPDHACRSTAAGERFADWFDEHRVEDDHCAEHVASVPLSRIYEVADEARRRAEVWLVFSRRLEARVARL